MLTTWERIPARFAEIGYTVTPGPLDSDCWIWNGRRNPHGYGVLFTFRAHRISYEIVHGGIPDDLLVRHQCHVRACVNPGHLLVGTYADNAADTRAAQRYRYGEANPSAKLTDAQVAEIRDLAATTSMLHKDIAKQYGVSQTLVSGILRGAKRTGPGTGFRVLRRTPTKEKAE